MILYNLENGVLKIEMGHNYLVAKLFNLFRFRKIEHIGIEHMITINWNWFMDNSILKLIYNVAYHKVWEPRFQDNALEN